MNCWDGPFKQHNSIILIVLMLNRYTGLGSVCCVSQKSHPVPSWTWIIEGVLCALIHLKCSLISLSPETDLSGKRRHCSYINEKLCCIPTGLERMAIRPNITQFLLPFITSTTTMHNVCTHFDHKYFSVYTFWYSQTFLDLFHRKLWIWTFINIFHQWRKYSIFPLLYDNEKNTSLRNIFHGFGALRKVYLKTLCLDIF